MADHTLDPVIRKDGSEGVPARGYSWPPFAEGHTLSLRHGANSPRVIAAKAHELEPEFTEWLDEQAPWARDQAFAPLRTNYLRTRAVVELLYDNVIDTAATKGSDAVPTRRFETLLLALRGELRALESLGLTPPTRAELAQTVVQTGQGLVDLKAAGSEHRKRRSVETSVEPSTPVEVSDG